MFDGTPFQGIEARDCVAFLWAARRPLADQWVRVWGRLPDREANIALAWWIARAGEDAWTFEQLAEWALPRMKAGEPLPPLLWEFVTAVLRGEHTKPKRRTNAADVKRDLIATLAVNRLVCPSLSQTKARDLVGKHIGLSGKGVESAKARADARFEGV